MARSRVVGVLLMAAAVVVASWVPFWWWAPVGSPLAFGLLALTPVVAAVAVVVAAVCFLARRHVAGVVAGVAAVALLTVVVPRAVDDGDPIVTPGPTSAPVTVATVNMKFGQASPEAIVGLVREQQVEVLGLQEVTPRAEQALAAAGLRAELPFVVSRARNGAGGTALLARHPLAPSGLVLREGVFSQVTARVLAPSGPVDVVVAHPAAPVFRDEAQGWAREIENLPGPAPLEGPPRLVLGDLNATLDHRPLRQLLSGEWSDSAAAIGAGLRGTWPTDSTLPPFAAIDHVLVSGPVAPADLTTHVVPGSDHAGVVVRLLVRDGRAPVTPGA
ncbi:endonuclease/exonuclease/phosphatase (EEP) superfamily protein YafD [Actinomycetospora succinea]|uniref:Endonuclease/exonuclease/phosphatase (EEP) superfamily protein YafD n=1 Tax=Actinomycetospora succinea TaxID=663603 RepID=A0A4R6UK35_9PSEU|nr:endonuclease/exonuclease/phosphatase family protein [Actinomycetospora succinea]TDQ47318.1 endonuclease/exonuclease/phosphatase (EEP) superfamily protein YafD [Actinomycetospora succinea]